MTCVRPNQKNVLRFLRQRGPATVERIRFSLDSVHGCVWPPSRVSAVLEALWAKDLVSRKSDVWAICPGARPTKRVAKVYSFNNGGKSIHVRAYSKRQLAAHFGTNMYQLRGYCDPIGPGRKGEVDVDLT